MQLDAHNGPLIKTQYGNGDELRYEYNKFGQKRKVFGTEYEGTERTLYSYIYNSSGALQYISDKKNDIRTIVDYDSLGRLSKTEIANDNSLSYIGSTEYDYDKRGNVSKIVTNYGGVSHTQKYLYGTTSLNDNSESYKKDGLASAYQLYSSRYAMYEYDSLNRFTQRKLTLDKPLYYNYTFNSSARNEDGGNKFRTTQVAKEFIGKNVFLYYYDDLGNITSIRKAQRTGSGSSTEIGDTSAYRTYEYDALGQLLRENYRADEEDDRKTYTYEYDKLGNISEKKVYDYTVNSLEKKTPKLTITYEYEELVGSNKLKSWDNALVSVDLNGIGGITSDEKISYDRIGNPTTYLGATLTWFGRQLTSYSKGDTSVSYRYNEDGLRTWKKVNGVEREYVYIGDQLHYEKRGSKNIFYFYDCNGYITGLEYDGVTYYPATTLNGDVVAIYDHNGTCLVEYEYDAWGNCEIKYDKTDFDLAKVNPIRYRGYYYDRETGLYYLQSRYYNPAVGRFLNADGYITTGQGVLSFNMYAYCQNNPVMYSDNSGCASVFSFLTMVINKITTSTKERSSSFLKDLLERITAPKKQGCTTSLNITYGYTQGTVSASKNKTISSDTSYNYAVQETVSTGGSMGTGASIGASISFTNANNVDDLNGESTSWGFTLTGPIGVSFDVSEFVPSSTPEKTCYGFGIGISIGGELELHNYDNYTTTQKFYQPFVSLKEKLYG